MLQKTLDFLTSYFILNQMTKKQILEEKFGYLFVDNPDPLYIRALAHLGAKPVFTYKLENYEPMVYCGIASHSLTNYSNVYTPERFQTCCFSKCTEKDLDDFENLKKRVFEDFDSTMRYIYFLPFYLYFN